MNRRQNSSFTLLQASQECPTLARLTALSTDSSARLKAIAPLIPTALQSSIKAGPIDGSDWCLILDNTAAAAKIRQLLPSMASLLRSKGWEVNSIRLKVQISSSR